MINWIETKNKLPKNGQIVIGLFLDGDMYVPCIFTYCANKGFYDDIDEVFIKNVDYWSNINIPMKSIINNKVKEKYKKSRVI